MNTRSPFGVLITKLSTCLGLSTGGECAFQPELRANVRSAVVCALSVRERESILAVSARATGAGGRFWCLGGRGRPEALRNLSIGCCGA